MQKSVSVSDKCKAEGRGIYLMKYTFEIISSRCTKQGAYTYTYHRTALGPRASQCQLLNSQRARLSPSNMNSPLLKRGERRVVITSWVETRFDHTHSNFPRPTYNKTRLQVPERTFQSIISKKINLMSFVYEWMQVTEAVSWFQIQHWAFSQFVNVLQVVPDTGCQSEIQKASV